jgi:outer membrane protein TolC
MPILLLLIAPGLAAAERPVTYAEALREAAESNATLIAAHFSLEQADAGIRGAKSIFDPSLHLDSTWNPTSRMDGFFQGFAFAQESRGWDLSTGLNGQFGTGTAYSVDGSFNRNISSFISDFAGPSGESIQDAYSANMMFSLTQQLLKGHRFAYNTRNITEAKSQHTLAELTLAQTYQQVLAETASAYWNWVYQVALTEITEASVLVAEEALRVGEAKVEAGELAPVEATRLRAAHVQAQSSALDARNRTANASDTLLLLMGLPSGDLIIPATQVGEITPMALNIADTVEAALAQNQEIKIAQIRSEAAELGLRHARHGVLPTLSATATSGVRSQYEAEAQTVKALAGLSDNAYPWLAVSSNLSVPLGNRAARSEQATASAELSIRRKELDSAVRSVRSKVEEKVRTLTASQERIKLADAQFLLAEETLTAEEALVEAGRSIYKDLLEARNELASARGGTVKARIDHRIARVELLRLQGMLRAEQP